MSHWSSIKCSELTDIYIYYRYSPYGKYITRKQWEELLKQMEFWCCDETKIREIKEYLRGVMEYDKKIE